MQTNCCNKKMNAGSDKILDSSNETTLDVCNNTKSSPKMVFDDVASSSDKKAYVKNNSKDLEDCMKVILSWEQVCKS